jgi:hypothetical protein
MVGKLAQWAWLYVRLRRIYLAIKRDPRRFDYADLAMTPVADDELCTHELFRTDAARIYLGQERRLEKARNACWHNGLRPHLNFSAIPKT